MTRTSLLALAFAAVLFPLSSACPNNPPVGEGEGEGGEGEGEGGQGGEGEGEGGQGGEGEGEGGQGGEGEGEGQAGEGEGEGGNGTGVAGDPCTNDSFCQNPLVCGFDTAGGSPLATTCQTAPSGGAVGTPCNDPTQCAFHLCLGGQCSQPCLANGDCAATQACGTNSVTVDGVGGVLDVCEPNGNLPPTACAQDSDCAATNRLCNDLVTSGTNLVLQCGFPGAGAGNIGDACNTDSLQNLTQCHTGLCDGATNGQCTAACNDNTDCGGNGNICAGSGFSNVPGGLCAHFCTKESDCGGGAGRSCQLRDNTPANRLDQVCTPDDGALAPGTSTVDSANCQTGFTITQNPDTFCSAICSADADCSTFAPATHCGSVAFNKPTSGTQNVSVCVKP